MNAPQALIKNLEGEVSITRNGESVAVKTGDFLLPGDEVVTGGTGRLTLEFPGTDGQIPAAGVMTANGKLTLGEQPGPQGQQIVVLEENECFEFTTELAENSAAVEGGTMSGLFGAGLLGAGGGSIAGAGALAAGAFLAGGSGDSSSDGTTGARPNGIGVNPGQFSSSDSPQSIPEFINENLAPENLVESVVTPVQNAVENSQSNPQSTPANLATAVEQVSVVGLENLHDALVATTGEGTAQSDLIQQLVDGINQTPLAEPLSPVTNLLETAVNTELGLDTLIAALPNVDPANGGLVTSVVELADDITQPLSQQIEPVDQLMDTLHAGAVEVDTVLESVLDGVFSQITTEVPNLSEGDLLGSVSTGISSGADALGGQLGTSCLPLEGLTGSC